MSKRLEDSMNETLDDSGGQFVRSFEEVSKVVHSNAVLHGWWDEGDRNFGEQIALMHSELSEALEAWREGDMDSEHVEGMPSVVEELADVIIRIMDTCFKYEYPLADAIIEKTKFNITREYRHGNKRA